MSGFKLGELLVSSEPYAYVLSNEYRGKFCDCCFKEKNDLKRCSQCSLLYFCDRKCQKKAWDVHKNECKYIQKAGRKIPTTSLRLISLIIFKIKKYGKEVPCEEVHGRKVTFSTLMSHAENVKKDIKRCQIMMAMVITLKEYIGSENVPPPEEFTDIFGKMSINAFNISHEGRPIGSGLYLGGSMFDHSCDFDALTVFDGPTLNVRMRRSVDHIDISKVYISYIGSLNLTEDRQAQLKEQYYFTCQCLFCTTSKFDEMMAKLNDDSDETKTKALKCKQDLKNLTEMMANHKDPQVIHSHCKEALAIQGKIMAHTNICRIKTFEITFELCIQLKLYPDAILIGAFLLNSYRLYYGEYHDILGLHLFKLGKILHFQEFSRQAVPRLTEAESILKISHGEQHYLYKDLCALLEEVKFASLCESSNNMALS